MSRSKNTNLERIKHQLVTAQRYLRKASLVITVASGAAELLGAELEELKTKVEVLEAEIYGKGVD